MGIYYLYVCCDIDGRVVAQFNPQHGFGGLKWGEFVGTNVGTQMLNLLKNEFCPRGCSWGIVSDAGFVSSELSAGSDHDLYELATTVPDFALNSDVRQIALDNNLASQTMMDIMDEITEQLSDAFDTTPLVADLAELNGGIVDLNM